MVDIKKSSMAGSDKIIAVSSFLLCSFCRSYVHFLKGLMRRQTKSIFIVILFLRALTGFPNINTHDNFNLFEKSKASVPLSDTGLINGIKYEFIQEDTFYSFRGSFLIKTKIECITNVSFDFDHKIQYTLGAKSIRLVRQGVNWYEVSYTYQKFFFFLFFIENTSNWLITLIPEKNRIVFKMISNQSNVEIANIVLTSMGYYQFRSENNGFRIEYFQECLLKSGPLTKPYISAAKKDAIKFVLDYKEYMEKTCEIIK